MKQRRIFDESYSENVRFGPDEVARVRLMRPGDRERLLAAPLPRSRLRLELDFFCEEDGPSNRQVALIALSEVDAAIGAARGFRVGSGAWSATVTAIDPELSGALLNLLALAMQNRAAPRPAAPPRARSRAAPSR